MAAAVGPVGQAAGSSVPQLRRGRGRRRRDEAVPADDDGDPPESPARRSGQREGPAGDPGPPRVRQFQIQNILCGYFLTKTELPSKSGLDNLYPNVSLAFIKGIAQYSSSLATSEDTPPVPAQKPRTQPAPKPTEASVGVKRRKRKRVLKSRTFVDDEGCIVTEKAYESQSCTESEEDVRTKPAAAPKAPVGPPKKDPKEEKRGTKKGGLAPGKANKQASIMGFFQKK
ncbi:PREDICTED: DNA polymerase delta subunit 3-like [Thamnophis sirtalis]|uniref:DNA polymerase delta subunit 3-like n=1 Tax=Thamnophis sirtalis TaxID=35019 RepID=A0A6I9YLC5_9SAUR|nr:PREDICTED: DNA polymerase delta subunit 3-like [Thamnophis sirtalis]